jgi:hypothetical protein
LNNTIPYSRRRRGLGLRFATLCVATAVSLNIPAKEPAFEQVFSEKGEPDTLHYLAAFTSNGAEHHLEVWRDGEQRVKRRTDDAIETYAFRSPGDPEFHLSILDLKKRIHTRIDRTNLYRIGNFTDWFDLTHGLKHPMGEYRVARAQAPIGAPKAIKACQWYDLTQDQRTSHICWSAHSRIPLVIQTQDGKVVWRVTNLDQKPIPAKTFDIHDEGFIHNDANQDIERD